MGIGRPRCDSCRKRVAFTAMDTISSCHQSGDLSVRAHMGPTRALTLTSARPRTFQPDSNPSFEAGTPPAPFSGMRLFTISATALLALSACSNTAKDTSGSNDPSSVEPAQPADLDASPAPFNEMDPTPAPLNDSDATATTAPQKTVYTARDPFLEPTLSAACGWDKPTVYFSTDSAKVGLVGDIKMDLLATCLNADTLAGDPVVVMGYADERGSEAYNRKLGLERANAVKADLVEAGVSASRIETYSRGEYFVDGDDEHRDDRRVVIRLDK